MKAVASANQRPNIELLFVEREKTTKTTTSVDIYLPWHWLRGRCVMLLAELQTKLWSNTG